eukprot:TRINITY_DN8504_c0_g1_i1.p1 TRINITY_DN8504_c0_g1~~TRINITY_DN8504_c0_g1_i1.p1  ORF type:complete len:470 (+),score=144.77 TRINITY_DN8504_c0_g1_i1:59-1468(+)
MSRVASPKNEAVSSLAAVVGASGLPVTKLRRRQSLEGFAFEKGSHITVASVLERKINWSDYAKDELFLHEEDIRLITDLQGAPAADLAALAEEAGQQYADTLLKATSKISVEDTLQYLLALTSQLLDASPVFVGQLATHINAFDTYNSILHRSNYDQFTIETAARILGILFAYDSPPEKAFKDFLNWGLNILMSSSADVAPSSSVLSAFKDMLKSDELQRRFIEERGLRALSSVLASKKSNNVQLSYNLGYCTWVLSFKEFSYDAFIQSEILENIVTTLKNSPRDKVARVLIATIANLIGKASFNEFLINVGATKVVRNLLVNKGVADEDALADLEMILKSLEHDLNTMTTYEIYLKEVTAGKLHWTQVHTEKFWKENVLKTEDNEFQVIRSLITLLDSDSVETVAIACYDLGEFARFYPGGKKIIQRLKGKEKLLVQMSNPAPEIQRQALIAVQKLMVQNWAGLDKPK